MLHYDWIDVSEDTDINKTNDSHECYNYFFYKI